MRGGAIILLFLLKTASAQTGFLPLRYLEDYRYLKNDSILSWYQAMKYAPLGRSGYFSQGGEVRYQFQHFTNEDWGEAAVERSNAFYTRFLYHADMHLSENFRVFGQLNSSFAAGRATPPRSIDQNMFDLQQVFIDYKIADQALIRAGRQELLYGAQRLIAVREGPNNRQSFDAVKLELEKDKFKADVFFSYPVMVRTGIWDDRINFSQQLWSVYLTARKLKWLRNVDLYYIGYFNSSKTYFSGSARELRHSIGSRFFNRSDQWSYDMEMVYQFGSWGSQAISAYTASLDVTRTFHQHQLKPSLGLKTEMISGDRSTNDDVLHTFNALFPRGAYFGLAALIGPANLVDFHPSAGFELVPKLRMEMDYDLFWRYSSSDGIYGPNVQVIFNAPGSGSFIGHQLGLNIEYLPSRFLKINPEVMWFFPGRYLKEVSQGKTVFFTAFTAQLRF